jgi:hypothetical protein
MLCVVIKPDRLAMNDAGVLQMVSSTETFGRLSTISRAVLLLVTPSNVRLADRQRRPIAILCPSRRHALKITCGTPSRSLQKYDSERRDAVPDFFG